MGEGPNFNIGIVNDNNNIKIPTDDTDKKIEIKKTVNFEFKTFYIQDGKIILKDINEIKGYVMGKNKTNIDKQIYEDLGYLKGKTSNLSVNMDKGFKTTNWILGSGFAIGSFILMGGLGMGAWNLNNMNNSINYLQQQITEQDKKLDTKFEKLEKLIISQNTVKKSNP
jgi:hypothetical protein